MAPDSAKFTPVSLKNLLFLTRSVQIPASPRFTPTFCPHMKAPLLALLTTTLCGCASVQGLDSAKMNITEKPFGTTKGGQEVTLYTLTNARGHDVSISTLGGTIVSLMVPDRDGKLEDVVLGFDTLRD